MLFYSRLIQRSWPQERFLAWESGWLVVICLAAMVAISPNVADPDLWGHVQYGREMWQHGLANHTTHSYAAAHQPWINHEILAEVLLASVAEIGGGAGLLIIKMMLGGVLLGGLLWRMRAQRLSLLTCTLFLLFTANGLARFWSLRPQLISFMAYAALLALLSWIFADWEQRWQLRWFHQNETNPDSGRKASAIQYNSQRMRWLWMVPLLMMLWTNSHGGFLAGECLYAAYLTLRGCEYISQRGWQANGLLKRFALMIAVAWWATCLNPYGYHFHVWLWHDLAVPRPEIVEWLPPDFTQTSSWPLLCLIVLSAVSLCGSRLPHDFTHVSILGLTLWQALSHERHIPFFAISCAFFLPLHFQNVCQRWGLSLMPDSHPDSNTTRKVQSSWHSIGLATGLLLALGCVSYKLWDRLSVLKVQCHEFPVHAVKFMAEHQLHGRILCTMNWAQYLLAAFPSELSVHIDGRLRTAYSQELLDAHFDFLYGAQSSGERYRSPHTPFEPARVLADKYPNLALIHRGQPHSVQVLESQGREWVLLYQDGLAQLWGRATRYNDPHSSDYLAPNQRVIHNDPPSGFVAWPAFPHADTSTHFSTMKP